MVMTSTIFCAGMCITMDLLHSKILTHLEDGLNQQSSSMTKETVDITITVTSVENECLCMHLGINEHAQ